MSMWSRSALCALTLALALPGTAMAGASGEARPTETGVAASTAGVEIVNPRVLNLRRTELDSREARLRVWEQDLTRRAQGERYFTDLEGYVTPAHLLRAVLVASTLSVLLTLVLIRLLEQYGLWPLGSKRTRRELLGLESRVATGLREFDQLLSRLFDRLYKDVRRVPAVVGAASSGASVTGAAPGVARAGAATDATSERRARPVTASAPGSTTPVASTDVAQARGIDSTPGRARRRKSPSGAPVARSVTRRTARAERVAPASGSVTPEPAAAPARSGRRQAVLDLFRRGLDRDEIGRRTGLGPAEIDFIVRLEGER